MSPLARSFVLPALFLLALGAVNARAAEPTPAPPASPSSPSTIVVLDPYVRLLPPTARHTAAFFVIENRGARDVKLVGASTDVARAELHNHVMEGGVMKMRPVAAIDVPAGGKATLAPGGLHVMLMDLVRPLTKDEVVVITLRFEDGTTSQIAAPVRAVTAPAHP